MFYQSLPYCHACYMSHAPQDSMLPSCLSFTGDPHTQQVHPISLSSSMPLFSYTPHPKVACPLSTYSCGTSRAYQCGSMSFPFNGDQCTKPVHQISLSPSLPMILHIISPNDVFPSLMYSCGNSGYHSGSMQCPASTGLQITTNQAEFDCYKKQCNRYNESMDYMVGTLTQAREEIAKLGLLVLQKQLYKRQLEASQYANQ
jgi:hypothetical protein